MHDLYAAQDILEAAKKTAKSKKLKIITKLVIELGQIEDHGDVISEENLRFNLQLLSKNTVAQDAKVVIHRTKSQQCVLAELEGNR